MLRLWEHASEFFRELELECYPRCRVLEITLESDGQREAQGANRVIAQ